jgi:MtN3 and saliva related transmembrane protein
MTLLYILATLFGAIGGIANLPQAYKIFKRKSAADISILTYLFIFTGAIIWVLYGIEIMNLPIIIANSFGLVCVGLVILGWYLYGRKNNKNKLGSKKRN